MNPIQAVHEGIRRLGRNRRMWFVFWFYNLAFALVVAIPLAALLFQDLGHSAYARQMLGNFEIQWFSEFFLKSGGWTVTSFTIVALAVGVGYFLLSTFLYGGALTILADPEARYKPAAFYQGCGRNFGRLFRLLLFSLVFYAAVFIASGMLHNLGDRIWESSMEGRPVILFNWFRAGLVLLLLLAVNMVFDYAKIRLVVEDSRKAVRAGLGSFLLVGRHFGRCVATYGIVAALFVVFYLVFLAVSGPVPREAAWGLLVLLLMQQAFVVSRVWVKLLLLSSQAAMYESLKPPAPVAEPAAAPPRPPEMEADVALPLPEELEVLEARPVQTEELPVSGEEKTQS